MREHLTVVTRKGQITLPAEVRRAMGLQRGDRVAIVVEDDGQVHVTPAGSVIARTAGAVRTDGPPLTAEQLREAAEAAWVEDVVERGG